MSAALVLILKFFKIETQIRREVLADAHISPYILE